MFFYWNVGLDGKSKTAFCYFFLDHMKRKSQPYTLHSTFLCRRHYRMRPVSVRTLTAEVLFVRFYIMEKIYYNRIVVRTLYAYDYNEENK